MGPETINAIKEALTPIAEKIGVGAANTWDIVVKGQIAEGYAYLAMSAVILVAVIIWAIIASKLLKRYSGESWMDSDNRSVVGIVTFFVTVFGLFFFSGFLYSGVFHIMAPEYKAIEFFIDAVKPSDND